MAVSLTTAEKLLAALEDPDLEPIRRLDPFNQRDEFAQLLSRSLERRCFEEVAARFKAQDIWFARVATYDELPSHPQARHNDTFAEVALEGERVRVVNHPIRYDGVVPQARGALPGLGEHSQSILQSLGLDDAEIERLAASGAVRLGEATVAA